MGLTELKRFLLRDEPAPTSKWCLVGNIRTQAPWGPGGEEIRSGTKHFSAGTKVYCMPAAWGDGYEKVIVFGKHRGAHGLVQMVVPSKVITHWRAQVVYSPSLLAKLEETRYYSWRDEAEVRHWAAMLHERDP